MAFSLCQIVLARPQLLAAERDRLLAALGGPSMHSSLLVLVWWVTFPVSYLLGVGPPVEQAHTAWTRLALIRAGSRVRFWIGQHGVRLGLGLIYGLVPTGIASVLLVLNHQPTPPAGVVEPLTLALVAMVIWYESILTLLSTVLTEGSQAFIATVILGVVLLTLTSVGLLTTPMVSPALGFTLDHVQHMPPLTAALHAATVLVAGHALNALVFTRKDW
ncbi:MAG: hypothetical protein K6V97_14970 [Actinomycetia bacterium]|nr:hypothetical protein [Actinomycetes bacterium]